MEGAPGESLTALGVAAQRAAHLLLDDPPPILDDPVSIRLLGPGAEAAIHAQADRYRSPWARALRAHVLTRSRYAEDALAAAVTGPGIGQFVILGAGLDTCAWRQPAWAAALTIAELDHPGSQAAKRSRLAEAGLGIPANVRLAPIDLAVHPETGLPASLATAGIDLAAPVVVTWLGVMMYLPPTASEHVLRALGRLAPGSELVLTFAGPAPGGPDLLADAAARAGEPWLDRLGPDEMVGRLRAAGFGDVRLVSPGTILDRYLADRADLPAPRRASIAHARIAP
jgi:methyltransferase (TIGR00027 family)